MIRCFYQSNPTWRGNQKRLTAIWRCIGTFEITEERLVDQAWVTRRNEWLTEMEVKAIRKKNLTPTDGEENQEINDIPVIEEETEWKWSKLTPLRQMRKIWQAQHCGITWLQVVISALIIHEMELKRVHFLYYSF